MHGLFEAEFGVHMVSAQEKLCAVAAEGESAEQLWVLTGSPLPNVERLSMTYGGDRSSCDTVSTAPGATTIATI